MKGIIRSFLLSEHDRQKNTSLQFGEETLENQPLVLAEDFHTHMESSNKRYKELTKTLN